MDQSTPGTLSWCWMGERRSLLLLVVLPLLVHRCRSCGGGVGNVFSIAVGTFVIGDGGGVGRKVILVSC